MHTLAYRSQIALLLLTCLGCSGDDPNEPVQQESGNQVASELVSEPEPLGSEPETSSSELKQTDSEDIASDSGSEATESDSELEKYAQIAKKLREHTLPTIEIKPSKVPPKTPWQSRFGGVPYWPKSKQLPKSPNDVPLYLLAQINFSETPDIPNYPTSGILQIFIAADDLYGLEFSGEARTQEQINKDPRGHKLVYHPTVDKDTTKLLTTAPIPESFPVTGSYSLTFKKKQDTANRRDYRFKDLIASSDKLSDELHEKLSDEFSTSGSKIGGYALFSQTDPRAHESTAGWILLLQIDTDYDDDISIMWGDSGVGNFFIKPADLAKKDFSNVWYNWDCY